MKEIQREIMVRERVGIGKRRRRREKNDSKRERKGDGREGTK